MKSTRASVCRIAIAACAMSLLVACSDDDPEGGLLAGDGSGGGADSSTPVLIELNGPTCVTAGESSEQFTATVTTSNGSPVSDTFVGIEGNFNDEAAGTVRATGADGRTRLGGANTNSNGIVRFFYTPPEDINTSIVVNLIAQVLDEDELVRGEQEIAVEVALPSRPRVRLQGPQNPVTGNRVASGSLELEPGDLASDFLVTIDALDNCEGQRQVLNGVAYELTAAPVVGAFRQTDTTTGIDGTALFDYVAPATRAARTTVTLTASASNSAGEGFANYTLDILPDPPEPFLRVTLDGPSSVPAGSSQDGYVVNVEQVQLDNDGNETVTAAADRRITLTSSDDGTFDVTATNNGLNQTDDFGQLLFAFAPAASGTAAQTVQVTATVATTGDAEAATLCSASNADCSDVIDVQVQADTFEFTAPSFGSSGQVGSNNAVPLSINWRDGSGNGVTGCVNLTTTFSGSGNADFGLVINDDTVNTSQQRTNVSVINGQFERSHALFSDRSGFVEVIAVDNRDCAPSPTSSLTASTGVQFNDVVCDTTDAQDCVDLQAPIRVLSSPDESGNQRTADLTIEVRNDAFEPIDGARITFEITAPASAGDPNERVFPGGGTTNANGIANSTYFVPTFNPPLAADEIRIVEIQGCVRGAAAGAAMDGRVCRTRRIEIVAPPAP